MISIFEYIILAYIGYMFFVFSGSVLHLVSLGLAWTHFWYVGRRIYYLVYEDLKLVLLVATSNKKTSRQLLTISERILKTLETLQKTFLSKFLKPAFF